MSWIKVRTNLRFDPKVLAISKALAIPPTHVVGLLVYLWSYADEYSVDGALAHTSKERIDDLVVFAGFAEALRSVGWLKVSRDGCVLPRYAEHNGATAKARAQGAARVAKHRASSGNGRTVTREEKRREDKRRVESRGARRGGASWM
jgi:hypothetical protein